jgi:uncharacterized membrane protein
MIVVTHTLVIAIFAALCYGTGRALTARLPAADGALAFGVGFCAFAQVLFVLALCGALTRIAVFVLLLVMLASLVERRPLRPPVLARAGGRGRPPLH